MTTNEMTAVVACETGATLRSIPVPAPASEQVLVKVAAIGVNRGDLNAAKGKGIASAGAYGKPIGMEWAGEIVALGDGVGDRFSVGDRVVCSGTGGYAQYATADMGRTIRVPLAMDSVQAAILPLALMTAPNALVTERRFTAGQTVLV